MVNLWVFLKIKMQIADIYKKSSEMITNFCFFVHLFLLGLHFVFQTFSLFFHF